MGIGFCCDRRKYIKERGIGLKDLRGLKNLKGLAGLVLAAGLLCLGSLAVRAEDVASPYTGEPIPREQAQMRPIAVMIPTDKAAQPAYGIGNADILYEVMEEGNMSRQLAIIPDWENLDKIGNVRSCRKYYIPLATEWDPILIHFGGVIYMKDRITAPDINNLSGAAEYGTGGASPGSQFFFRDTDRPAPHNAYISANGIRKACKELGYSLLKRSEYYHANHFSFAEGQGGLDAYGAAALEATGIDLSEIFPYSASCFVYDAKTGVYKKMLRGKAQIDGLTSKQLSFANVIVQYTGWEKLDDKGYLDFKIQDNGREGYFFTKGKGIHITWRKSADYGPTRYYDDNGKEIQLTKGKTYIAIAQQGKEVSFG